MTLPTIACDGTHFILTIPSPRQGVEAHPIRIPCDKPEVLRRVLLDYARLHDRRIGTAANPVQYDIDKMAALFNADKAEAVRGTLADAGLDFDNLMEEIQL
jgi:hypothetical protein